jgi:hypothetical protein
VFTPLTPRSDSCQSRCMSTFQKIVSGFVMVMALMATLGCAGERRNVYPLKQSIASARLRAHIANSTETGYDIDGNEFPLTTCFLAVKKVDRNGEVVEAEPYSENLYPDRNGNIDAKLPPGLYRVELFTTANAMREPIWNRMAAIGGGKSLDLGTLNASPQK